ncbi:arginase family protein [Apibacter muscae]|uniref:arginase family protein n=1 Tax=Apibacter muscae TaxID=2509004 RepID=UPI0011ADD3E4|nr:arginase family protein [Apibacter muscae]TWP29573.1 arginase family protein [Apibacter muscae]
MNKEQNTTLRLIYPQWQGGIISPLVPELSPEDSCTGYYLGARLLNFLAPNTNQKTIEVPISLNINDRAVKNGINSYQVIYKQTQSALEILKKENPQRIVTLGGECSVSIVPFTYLASKYPDDVAIIWIDAHPDLNLPYDKYEGYHAMALTASLGMGDEKLINLLPGKVDASKALLVGLRAWDEEGGTPERQKALGIKHLTGEEVAKNSKQILNWIKATKASKVVIHFDLDVIDPNEMVAAVGTDPDGMKINEVVRIINDIASSYDLVGLTIAEPMPRVAIKIKNMLEKLPLIQ